MKTTIIITALFLISLNLKAQEQELIENKYYAQPDLKKFAGEWVYQNDSITFNVNLRLEKFYFKPLKIYMDRIQGYYIFKKNGITVANSKNLEGESAAIYGGGFADKSISKNLLHFLFIDLNKKSKLGSVLFELLDTNQAKWILTNTEGIRVGYYDITFSVPEKAVFKRVN